jgi:hypothetical protein
LTVFADGAILVAYQAKRKAGRMKLPVDRYEYELEDYGLTFDWTTYEDEYGYKPYVHKPTGAIEIMEDEECEKDKFKSYCTVIGVLASTEIDENGYPKYRRLAKMIVFNPSNEYVRAYIEKSVLADRWMYEGAWLWRWSSLPTRGRRRFLNFLVDRGRAVGYRLRELVDRVFDGIGRILSFIFQKDFF